MRVLRSHRNCPGPASGFFVLRDYCSEERDKMPKSGVNEIIVDKREFDATLRKLINTPAIPKKEMTERVKANSRRLPPMHLPKSPAR